MKTLKLPAAMIGLTALLTACPQTPTPEPVPPTPSKVNLTLNLTGPSAAPVKVTNTTTNTVLNDGALSSGKTFGDLAAGTVLKVEPGNVDGFTTPAAQTVTLDASKTITLEYKTLPGSPVQTARVAGSVTGAPAAATRAVLIGSGDYDFSNTGTVKAGVLDLPLTEAPDSRSLFNLTSSGGGCTFTGTQTSNPSVALFTDVELFSEKIDSLAFATEQIVSGGTVPNSQVARLYSAAAATVKGTILCNNPDGTKFTVTLDVILNTGWNAVEYAETNSTLTLRSLSSGVRSELKATAYTPSVLVSLGSDVTITSDAGVSVPARLYQEGGYTGQVSLSTDVAGLTIEPSTVNLTATTLQSVQAQATAAYLKNLGVNPQRLDTNLTFKYSGQGNYSGPFSVIVRDTTGKQVGGGYGSLDVRRPGLTLGTCGYSAVELYPSSTASLNVCGSSVGNFSGPVTYSATGLPAGVSVTPVTQTLNGSSYVSLIFKSDATLKPGTYPITLTADGGTVKASAPFELKVPAPTVNIAVSGYYYGQQIYQGGTAQLNVDVSTQNGFNGQTTLTVTGLPAGVTAAPKTVTVTPGSTTTTAITLTATADAALGNSTIKVTSPDQSVNSYGVETQLSVRPARTGLGTYVSEAVAASSGLWAVTGSSYDSSVSASRSTVTRFAVDGKVAASGSVTSQSGLRLIETAGGVVAYKGSGVAPSLIADDGTVTDLPAVNFYLSESVTRRTDGQGRVWFVESSYTGTGGSTMSLKTWTPATGVVTTVDSSANYGYGSYGTSLPLSPDGNTLIYLGGSSGDALKIDTATGTVTKLDLLKSSGATSAAISADGTIWFSAYGQLGRLNADSTINKFTTFQAGTLIGFDQTNPTVLWGSDTSNVYRIDTAATPSATTISLGNISKAVLNAQGGLQVVTTEYTSNATNYYLSQLK
ncbi:hypothetical protein ACMT4L_00825 [Deinococcus sp. A31D244]|uniref:hypothetical protein n=1 Tax=Deinococcus sp. A31D244 TaxID=3397675 RepID=UPI0039E11328